VTLVGLCRCTLAFPLDNLEGPPVGRPDAALSGVTGTGDTAPGASAPGSEMPPTPDAGGPAPQTTSTPGATTPIPQGNPPVATDAGSLSASAPSDAAQGVDATSGADASAETASAGDASSDTASAGDASSGATADQEAGMDAGARSWCAANMTANTVYCNDFDETNSTIKGTWDSIFISATDCASFDSPADAPSRPNTLLLSTPIVPSGSTYQEQFTKYPTNVNSETLRFALKIVGFDANAKDVSLARVGYRSGAWAVSFDLSAAGAELIESVARPDGGPLTSIVHPVALPPLGVWTTIALTVDSAGKKVSLSYDGNAVAIQSATTMNPTSPGAAFSTILGVNYLEGPAQPMEIFYDNIAIAVN
jgi:hypothetical protein